MTGTSDWLTTCRTESRESLTQASRLSYSFLFHTSVVCEFTVEALQRFGPSLTTTSRRVQVEREDLLLEARGKSPYCGTFLQTVALHFWAAPKDELLGAYLAP